MSADVVRQIEPAGGYDVCAAVQAPDPRGQCFDGAAWDGRAGDLPATATPVVLAADDDRPLDFAL